MSSKFSDLLPSLLLRLWRRRRLPVRWRGDYGSWAAALSASAGYDDPANLERVRRSTARVRDGSAAFERDGIAFDRAEYSWPLLALLQSVAAAQGGRLDVVDFGGSLGTTYFQHRQFLDAVKEVRWQVIEQPAWVAAGREEFAHGPLSFHASFEAVGRSEGQGLLLSSVLPYLREPHAFLEEALQRRFAWVLIDRTGVLRRGERDRLTVQTVRPPLFDASYPCWFFARSRLLAHFASSYVLRAEFDALDGATSDADFRGFFFQRMS